MSPDFISERIISALPGADVEVLDTRGSGDHFQARVVSSTFAGKSMVEQHQAVYATLQDVLKTGELHALALKTYSPEQWERARAKAATASPTRNTP
jgi:acid stress-induced BolA-like protein IbaG/YrbA